MDGGPARPAGPVHRRRQLAGAIGVLLPALLRVRPVLSPLAGIGLATVMLLATGFHIMRAEYGVLVPVGLGALAAFVAWGRLRALPIAPRARK